MCKRRTKAFDLYWFAQHGRHVNASQESQLRNVQLPQVRAYVVNIDYVETQRMCSSVP